MDTNYFIDDPAERDRYRDEPIPDSSDPVLDPKPDPIASDAQLKEIQLDEDATLAIAYGQHVVAGNLVRYEYKTTPKAEMKFIAALGEGEWEGILVTGTAPNFVTEIYYGGDLIPAATTATTPGYKFHPGTLSSGSSDPVQGTPLFFPSDPPYSGTAYVEILLNEADSVEQRLDKFRGIFKCKKIKDYDSSGNPITGGATYSTNPARVAANLLERVGKLSLVDWPSWVAWRDYCDATISYGTATIKRFECHLVILASTSIANALTAITTTTCSFWQDSGDKIVFLLPLVAAPGGYTPVYIFTPSNSRNVSVVANSRTSLPTGYVATFRDINDVYMSEVTAEWVDEAAEAERGRNRVDLQLPPMHRSQAERICAYRLALDTKFATDIEWTGFGGSVAVLPGDIVRITNPVIPFSNGGQANTAFVLVTNTEDLPESDGASIRRIRGKRITTDGLYSDSNQTVPANPMVMNVIGGEP